MEEIVGSVLYMLEIILNYYYICVELLDEMVLINCDGSLLEWVFINLLENVYKYVGYDVLLGICVIV